MGPVADVAAKLEGTAASFVKENRLPGAAVGIVHGTELAWWKGIGFADVASRRVPDRDSLYRVASITKTFTGTAIMQLRDEGLLHLDDPVVAHLPEFREATSPFGPIETVTIRRMLSHESGLAGEPPGTDWAALAYEGTASRNLARAAEISAKIPPNTQQKYSNLAYQLLGEVVTRVSGLPYQDYVRTAILEPLGMTRSGFEPLPAALEERRVTGYAGRSFSDDLELASTPPTVWAEGGLWSCVDDLATWLSFQFKQDGGPRKDAQILAGRTLKEMHTARYLGNDEWTEAWCISWYAVRRDDVTWVQHSGGIHGFITNVCFDPKAEVGAIVLLNGIGDAPALAMDLAAIARTAARTAVPVIGPPAPTPEHYRPLLGIYARPEFGQFLRLEWRDGTLQFTNPDSPTWQLTLTSTAKPDVFVVEPGPREAGEQVTFRRLPDGRIASVLLAAATFVRFDAVSTVSSEPLGRASSGTPG